MKVLSVNPFSGQGAERPYQDLESETASPIFDPDVLSQALSGVVEVHVPLPRFGEDLPEEEIAKCRFAEKWIGDLRSGAES